MRPILDARDALTNASADPTARMDPPPLPPRRTPLSHSRHTQRHSTRRALRAALIVTLVVLGLVLVIGGVYTTALRARIARDADLLLLQESALGTMRRELAQLRTERDALASGRLPGLIPLEFDRALQIDRQYVRNIIFTETGTSGAHRYEYRIVIANAGAAVLRPAVRLLFFDDRGIQVGDSVVERDAIGAPTGLGAWLQPGETRSYSAVLGLGQDVTPHYFLLVVE